MINNHNFEEQFYAKLPYKPYCSWGKGERTLIRPKSSAIKLPIIQVNPPHQVNYLIFDIDSPDSYFRYFDADLPIPTWIAKNPKNGHSHVCYELKNGVCKTSNAKAAPLTYLASIQYTYAKKLGADLGYVGLLTKNPLDREWQVFFLNPRPFELDELADYVNLEALPKKPKEVSGLGRNCMLFDELRYWAYRAIEDSIANGYDAWCANLLNRSLNANSELAQPLGYSEIKGISYSIAKWVWRNYVSGKFHEEFSKIQSNRGKKGAVKANSLGANSKGGKARSSQYSDLRQEALKLHIKGNNPTKIAKQLGVSRPSVYKWLKDCQKV